MSKPMNEDFYLGVAWAHAKRAADIIAELRSNLPLGHDAQKGLRRCYVDLRRVVDFRTGSDPKYFGETVTEKVILALQYAHIGLLEAQPSRLNKTWRAISTELCKARRAVESQEV